MLSIVIYECTLTGTCRPITDRFFAFSITLDAPVELPIAVSSKQVRDVLRSELSTSVPVAKPAIAMGTSGNQPPLLHLRDAEKTQPTVTEAAHPPEGLPQTGNLLDHLYCIPY